MSLFRKKSPTPEEQAFQAAISEQFDRDDDLDAEADDRADDAEQASEADGAADGDGVLLDFGSLKVPAVDGMELRAEIDDQQTVVAIAVVIDETTLQLQAFAAPRSEELWEQVRQDIAEGIRGSQGKAREVDGPFGRELQAEVLVAEDSKSSTRQQVRFLGRDGERWFLRGVVSGAGATDQARAAAVEEVFAGVVVERGTHAAPPRGVLPLRLPDDPAFQGAPGSVGPPVDGLIDPLTVAGSLDPCAYRDRTCGATQDVVAAAHRTSGPQRRHARGR